LSKRPSDKKKEKALRKFSFLLPRFPPKPFSSRGKSGAYQFICEGRHVAEPGNHGNHSWLVPRARTKPSLLPVFFIIKRVWFLKGTRALCILFKGLKINFAIKEGLSQKIFYYMLMKP
jgi:hypothetical protein